MASKDPELGDFDAGYVECSHPGCEERFADHKWGSIQQAEGWFVKKDGSEAWCPKHLPAWVGPWRERQAAVKRRKT